MSAGRVTGPEQPDAGEAAEGRALTDGITADQESGDLYE